MPSSAPRLRAALVGARRRRMGTGPYLARHLVRAGGELVGIVGTSPRTLEEARADLQQDGIAPAGFLDVPDLLQSLEPELLIVASPAEAHREALDAALGVGCHVLCEKPILWGGKDPANEARRVATAFDESGLHLGVTAQWPFTLPTYRALHPGVLEADDGPSRFTMTLSPTVTGAAMIPDALPHALSLLQAIRPDAESRLRNVSIRTTEPDRAEIRFRYEAAGGGIDAVVTLVHQASAPRVAAYGFDGREAARTIEQPGYRLGLEADGRRIAMPDPLEALVQDFVERVSSGRAPARDPNAHPGLAHVAQIAAGWPGLGRADA